MEPLGKHGRGWISLLGARKILYTRQYEKGTPHPGDSLHLPHRQFAGTAEGEGSCLYQTARHPCEDDRPQPGRLPQEVR